MNDMKSVVVHDPVPPELEALIERRQALGQDRYDEVWEGVYHMTPGPSGPHAYLLHRLGILLDPHATRAGLVGAIGFNLGSGPDDYRVPDSGYLREIPRDVWLSTAAIVVEIVSPGDETYEKFAFHEAHGVEEIIVVDPAQRTISVHQRPSFAVDAGGSALLGITAADLAAAIAWPDAG